MKIVTFILCKEALFGVLSPISFFTLCDLQEAIILLKKDGCNFLYIAVDHFSEGQKELAEKYLNDKYIKKLETKLQSKIYVSASSKPYIEMLTSYIGQIQGDVCVDIFSRVDKDMQIEQAINANLHIDAKDNKRNGALVFTRGQTAYW